MRISDIVRARYSVFTEPSNLDMLRNLPKMKELNEFVITLREQNLLSFQAVIHEPVGLYLICAFLFYEHSVDKAIFINDVERFRKLKDQFSKQIVAEKIYNKYLMPEMEDHIHGISVFSKADDIQPWYAQRRSILYSSQKELNNHRKKMKLKLLNDSSEHKSELKDDELTSSLVQNEIIVHSMSFMTESTNSIGIYGRAITKVKEKIENQQIVCTLFDAIYADVINDLRLDAYPRFEQSSYFEMYIRCKAMNKQITISDFIKIGRESGPISFVIPCKKLDCGKLYCIKQINKKRVQAEDSLQAVIREKDYLAMMNSRFVTSLKYAFVTDDTLCIVVDLMLGGDLKYHLNMICRFTEDRTRFYAAQILLGLEHIHGKGIVYRDLKLENILVDEKGNIKISDLGLAVLMDDSGKVRGYAGTPGYTAPEVVLGIHYNHNVDYFSLGVLIYRCLCGRKPFLRRKRRNKADKKLSKKSSTLDRNVIEMEPEFPPQYFNARARSLLKGLMTKKWRKRLGYESIRDIKEHPWFDPISFGMLGAGFISPPFDPPNIDTISINYCMDFYRPAGHQYVNIKLTQEFKDAMKSFEYISNETIQKELVDVLIKTDEEKCYF